MAVLMGVYHQGGVIPAQIAIPQVVKSANASNVTVFWWKTYPAPTYLIGAPTLDPVSNKSFNITTVPIMGLSEQGLKDMLLASIYAADCVEGSPPSSPSSAIFLAAPLSAHLFDDRPADQAKSFLVREKDELPGGRILCFTKRYIHHRHINLDDLDFADDGVFGTLGRVFGRAGLGVWRVRTDCGET
jgi:phosphatidylinositol glycan class Z